MIQISIALQLPREPLIVMKRGAALPLRSFKICCHWHQFFPVRIAPHFNDVRKNVPVNRGGLESLCTKNLLPGLDPAGGFVILMIPKLLLDHLLAVHNHNALVVSVNLLTGEVEDSTGIVENLHILNACR